jgi:S1-C subfamily serine protease
MPAADWVGRWRVYLVVAGIASLLGGVGVRLTGHLLGGSSATDSTSDSTAEAHAEGDGPPSEPPPLRTVYARAAPGVVSISVTTTPLAVPAPEGLPGQLKAGSDVQLLRPQLVQASGVVIDTRGHVLTADHVIADADRVRVTFDDGSTVVARVVGSDPSTDLALLHVKRDAQSLHPIPLGSTKTLRVGDPVLAVGDPFGYATSASAGIVSGLGRSIEAPNGLTTTGAIQTDAAVNHGNSGGALLDLHGRLIGVPTQIADSGVNANVGVAFAVPVETVERVAADLERFGASRQSWLGISGVTITASLADVLTDLPDHGALVTEVFAASPALAAGVRAGTGTAWVDGDICAGGDTIVAINGHQVAGISDLLERIREVPPGTTVQLATVRAGDDRQIAVTLSAQPPAMPAVALGCGH